MLVYGPDSVFPKFVFPFRGGKVVSKYTLVAVKGDHLAGFLFQSHLFEQIFYAGIHRCGRVLIDIHTAVFIQVDPAFMIDFGRFDSC